MTTPITLFQLAKHNPIIADHIRDWKVGQCSFEEALLATVSKLQEECKQLFDTHKLKDVGLENLYPVFEEDIFKETTKINSSKKREQFLIGKIKFISGVHQNLLEFCV